MTATTTRVPSPTATIAPTATPTPHHVSAFICAAGSLPIGRGYTQFECTVTTLGPNSVLHAGYTGQGPNGPVDDPRLTAAGWVMIDETHGDSHSGAIGQDLYFNQSAWFAVGYSYPSSTMSVEQGIPLRGPAPILCGKNVTAGIKVLQGVPMPADMVETSVGRYLITPDCLQDVLKFYMSSLSAAGWKFVQPFQPPPGSVEGTPVTAVVATVQRGSSLLSIWLSGAQGTPTRIVMGPAT